MTTSITPDVQTQARDQVRALLVRSAVDMDFRHRLLTQPNAAYTEATGSIVPDSLQFKFVENRGAPTLVLPAFDDGSLRDFDLETVSGGTEPVSTTIAAVFVGVVAFGAGLWVVEKVTSWF